jgi:hypothetical protein
VQSQLAQEKRRKAIEAAADKVVDLTEDSD